MFRTSVESIGDIKRRLNIHRRAQAWRRAGVIFVHIPKAAGTSISTALYGAPMGHYSVDELNSWVPHTVRSCQTFSVVRNPYARALSAYRFAKQGQTESMGMQRPEQYQIHEFRSFHSFVCEWLANANLERVDFVFRPQVSFVTTGGRIAVDFLGRVEDLTATEIFLQEELGLALSIPKLNQTAQDVSWLRDYDRDTSALVRQIYAEDFEAFEYPSLDW